MPDRVEWNRKLATVDHKKQSLVHLLPEECFHLAMGRVSAQVLVFLWVRGEIVQKREIGSTGNLNGDPISTLLGGEFF